MTETTPEKQNKGFRCISPERQREIASMGGSAPHKSRSFCDKDLASRAGRMGGKRSRPPKKEKPI